MSMWNLSQYIFLLLIRFQIWNIKDNFLNMFLG